MKRTSLSLVLALIVLVLLAPAAWSSDSLSFFNNWFVTGDYTVAGVGLRGTGVNGWATGTIHMTGLPDGAQPIAAFLYWSTVETSATPGARIGYFNGNKIQASVLGDPKNPNPACSSSGGISTTPGATGQVYRADVLRYMPVDSNNIPKANGNHSVKLPDSGGNGNGSGPYTNGASLIVIYKLVVPGLPTIAPLRAVVIYNGAYSMDKHSAGLTQNVAGFYQAASSDATRISAVVANGQNGFVSPFSVNGKSLDNDPFNGAQGSRWDNPSYSVNLAANASSFSVQATVGNNQTCLTWAAIVTSVNVPDADNDGLLDLWETKGLHRNTQVSPATFGTCSDYPAEPCVNLPAMGANPNKKDIYIQADWMHGNGDGTGGIDGAGTHDHMPLLSALNSVANTFASHGVNVHFDVGNHYQGAQAMCGNAPCPYIVPTAYAQGGSDIDEATLVCHDSATHACDYHVPYPVLSFEFGFASVRDGNHLLNVSRHFAQNRRDVFRYSLFAHALAGPFGANGQPVDPTTGLPTTTPKSYSGIAHRPGGGFMVTLGLWRSDIPANDQVGSAQVQAGTLMHELGHNLGLGHAGLATKPNCMPNYPSVMNYLYQTRGLTDSSGLEQIDYSNGLLLPLSENLLTTSIPMGLLPGLQKFRVRYYGPLAPNQQSSQAAQLHCDGTPIKGGEPFEVRLEGAAITTPDWSNGTLALGKISPVLDVNYDGSKGQLFLDQPDWLTLNLQQIGTGYSFGGLSVGAFATDGGAFATDAGAFATDAGALATDGGAFATDGGAFATDAGAFATDGGAFATDGGAFATDGGAFATDAGEIDENTVTCSTIDAPAPPVTIPSINSISVQWIPPDTGAIASYNIYRCAGVGCSPSAFPAFKNITGGSSFPSFNDVVNDFVHAGASCPATATCFNTTYVYLITSLVLCNSRVVESQYSKTASAEVTHLFVIANSQTVQYGATTLPFPAPAFTVYGDVAGTLSIGVSCVYSPSAPRNVGIYSITCSGPATTSPTDGVTYNAAYLSNTPGVLTITARPITVTAAASSKVYDGLVGSPATPTITTGSLAYSDSVTWTETYDNRNVGNAHVMTPSGTVGDGNSGNNYLVKFVNASGGIITVRQTTVTAAASNRIFDGTTNSPSTPIPTPTLGSGDTTNFIETYDNRNVGTTHVMTPTGTVSDGNGGNNYALTFASINTGVITQAPASVTPNPNSKTYGTPDPSPIATGTLTGFLAADGVTATYNRVAGETVLGGPYTISATLSATGLLINYNITYNTAAFTINKANASVTPNPNGKTYGMLDPSPLTTGTLTGFLAADSVTATYNRTIGETVAGSPYTISATLSPANVLSNYNITYNTALFTISKANASVTPNANGKTYGTSDPIPLTTGILSGFVAADNVTATYTRVPGNDAGGYAISATLAPAGVLGNYNITINPATFTILPAAQSILFSPLSNQPFGIVDFTVTATASSGLLVTFTASGNCSVTPAGLVHLVATGNCTITASQSGSLNYQPAADVNQSFTITAIDFTTLVTAGSPSGVVPTATASTLTMSTATSQTSAAWLPAKQAVASGFTTQFTFQISPIEGSGIADGFAFVIQNSALGTGALGTTGAGGFIGYEGISNSLAIEFDTYRNDWDPNANHVAIQSNGTGPNTANHNTATLKLVNYGIATNLSDGAVHTVVITYDGANLVVTLDSVQVLTMAVNLNGLGLDSGGNAVVGFTAATGAASELTRISNWSFASH